MKSIANNLYGHAMSQPLPIGDYQWVSSSSSSNNDIKENATTSQESQLFTEVDNILNLSDDSEFGYIFDVDLHYPETIHAAHNDFPFCAEKQSLSEDAFNIITTRLNESGKKTNKIEKLLLTLYDKENYVLHYRMLKLALSHG